MKFWGLQYVREERGGGCLTGYVAGREVVRLEGCCVKAITPSTNQ
jgi:hypothetical protein